MHCLENLCVCHDHVAGLPLATGDSGVESVGVGVKSELWSSDFNGGGRSSPSGAGSAPFSGSPGALASPVRTILRSSEYSRMKNVRINITPAIGVDMIHIVPIACDHACNTASRRAMS